MGRTEDGKLTRDTYRKRWLDYIKKKLSRNNIKEDLALDRRRWNVAIWRPDFP
jgi:hypothetical protein